jgi:hypothetical protein
MRPVVGLALSATLGIAFFFHIFPRGFISGESSYFQTHVEDLTQYLSGYIAYVHEPWSWPLLRVGSINHPAGTLVTFLDSIPLLAFFLKFFGEYAPRNPYGYWVFLCFVLQSVATWIAVDQARPHWSVPLFASALAVQMPALSWRLGHFSLMAHFLIIFALALYLRDRRERNLSVWLWATLFTLAFYINIYLTAMCGLVFLASVVDLTLQDRDWRRIFRAALAFLPLALSVIPMLGLSQKDVGLAEGFGSFSMNLLAPIYSGVILQLPFPGFAQAGQGEGYNYLGFGILLLIALSASRLGRPVAGKALVAVLVFCFLFALSNEVYVGTFHLATIYVPEFTQPFLRTFRASGRFFWLVGYAMLLLATLKLAHRPIVLVVPILAAVLGVQFFDLRPRRIALQQLANRPMELALDEAEWRRALEGLHKVYLYPKFGCGAQFTDVLPIQSVVASAGMNLSTGYIARYSPDCAVTAAEIAASDPAHSAYVFAGANYSLEQAQQAVPAAVQCTTVAKWHRCVPTAVR